MLRLTERRDMLFIDNMDPTSLDFLAGLVQKSGGDTSVDVSMYEIGTQLGLDKETARHTAEDIIGRHLAEIVSLGGTIRLTDSGLEGAEKLGLAVSAPKEPEQGPLIAEKIRVKGTERELAILGPEGIEGLRDLAADLLRSAPPEAQADVSGLLAHLGSPKPKAGVASELLLAILAEMEDGEARSRALSWAEKLG